MIAHSVRSLVTESVCFRNHRDTKISLVRKSRVVPLRFCSTVFPFTQRSSKSISDDLYSTTEYEIEFYRRYVGKIFTDTSGKSALSYVYFLKSMFHKLISEITRQHPVGGAWDSQTISTQPHSLQKRRRIYI